MQEAGVDEADTVDSDGRYVYAFGTQPGGDTRVLRIGETSDGGTLQMHPDRAFASLTPRGGQEGLYVHDNRIALVTATAPSTYASASLWNEFWAWTEGKTRVEILDRSTPHAPVSLASFEFDGHLVSSRRIGNRLYVVLRESVMVDLEYPSADPANAAINRARIAATPTAELLPGFRSGATGEPQPLVPPSKVYLPVTGALPPSAEFVTIVGLDIDNPGPLQTLSVAGSVGAVYVSPTRMYLATTRNEARWDPVQGFVTQGLAVTDIHQLELGAEGPKVMATGSVEGFLDRDVDRAVFRFSEKDGRLRVVTVGSQWGVLGQNRLTVLEPSTLAPGLLKTLSYLPNRDRPAPIGKPNEQLYGTRFVGDKLYAVTFLRTDPMYVVDLTDPAHPSIDGAVELPGLFRLSASGGAGRAARHRPRCDRAAGLRRPVRADAGRAAQPVRRLRPCPPARAATDDTRPARQLHRGAVEPSRAQRAAHCFRAELRHAGCACMRTSAAICRRARRGNSSAGRGAACRNSRSSAPRRKPRTS